MNQIRRHWLRQRRGELTLAAEERLEYHAEEKIKRFFSSAWCHIERLYKFYMMF